MIVDISNKVIVVTGSARGIGSEMIKRFADENAKVVINYHTNQDEAIEIYTNIISKNPNCILVKADITLKSEVEKLYKETIKAFGHIDVLINNAGICDDNLIVLLREEQWNRVIDVNLTGTYLCSKIFLKSMIKRNRGKIINIASLKGQVGCEGQVNYSASKAGIIGFTKALAKEVGQFNISVNAICPGFIVTNLNKDNIEKRERAESMSLLDYEYSLDDLLNFITFMSSDSFNGISGRVFNLDSRV